MGSQRGNRGNLLNVEDFDGAVIAASTVPRFHFPLREKMIGRCSRRQNLINNRGMRQDIENTLIAILVPQLNSSLSFKTHFDHSVISSRNQDFFVTCPIQRADFPLPLKPPQNRDFVSHQHLDARLPRGSIEAEVENSIRIVHKRHERVVPPRRLQNHVYFAAFPRFYCSRGAQIRRRRCARAR